MSSYLSTTSFKDFEDIPGASIIDRAKAQSVYLNALREKGYMNYRLLVTSGCGPTVDLAAEEHLKWNLLPNGETPLGTKGNLSIFSAPLK